MKTITKVSPMGYGHLMLEFSDGSKQTVHRGDHEADAPRVGDSWPLDGHKYFTSGVQSGALKKV